MATQKVNDISMYYEIHGQGEPIVFVPGFSLDHTMWSAVVDKFKDEYQVILFDNRGSGQTDTPEGPYTIEQMAKDVTDLCATLHINKAHFVGNSMGGFIVQTVAHQHPKLVNSCVISNSSTTMQSPFQLYLDAQLELLKAAAPISTLIKAACSWIYSYHFFSQPGVIEKIIEQGLKNPFPFTLRGYEGQLAALEGFDSREWVKTIQAPTLVVSGHQDLVFNAAMVKSMADEIANSSYYCFADCGHLPPIEQPEKFVQLVKNFLQPE
jgi:3-oxoadipate enol-lactonase